MQKGERRGREPEIRELEMQRKRGGEMQRETDKRETEREAKRDAE